MKKAVLILMATYNGEKYLKEQINSLLSQTYKEWYLLISDDGSNDGTKKIIQDYCDKYANMELINNRLKHGPMSNFNYLINEAKKLDYEYIMFCDQDDVWMEDKIEKTLNLMVLKNKNTPILVFTDKEYVDENLNTLGYNLGKFNKFDFEILLHQNVIYGCTTMLNRALLNELSQEIPEEFLNHDHYIAIIAKILGEIYYIDYKSILYRQHSKNVTGNIKKSLLQKICDRNIYFENIRLFIFVAKFINENYFDGLNELQKIVILDIIEKIQKGGINALYYLLKNKIRKVNMKGNIRFWIEICLWTNEV